MNLPIRLHGAVILFVEVEEAPYNRIVFSEQNRRDLGTDILNELQRHFGRGAARALQDREPPLVGSRGSISSSIYRVPRDASVFEPEFLAEEQKLISELGKTSPDGCTFVLEVGCCDKCGFRPENLFGDYLYIFARLIRKDR